MKFKELLPTFMLDQHLRIICESKLLFEKNKGDMTLREFAFYSESEVQIILGLREGTISIQLKKEEPCEK